MDYVNDAVGVKEMTCIIGMATNNVVHMVADSMMVSRDEQLPASEPKMWIDGELLIGATGDLREVQVVRNMCKFPPHILDISDLEYLVRYVVPEIERALKESGIYKTDDHDRIWHTTLLVGFNGGLYEIDCDLAVLGHVNGFFAIGSGYPYAMGAYAILSDETWCDAQLLSPETRLRACMDVVLRFITCVGPPVVYMALEGVGNK